jgi:hypothetical protein
MEFSQLNVFLILPCFAFLLWLIIQSRSQSLTENPNFCIWWIWYGVLVCWIIFLILHCFAFLLWVICIDGSQYLTKNLCAGAYHGWWW